jgi:hypothetical protein
MKSKSLTKYRKYETLGTVEAGRAGPRRDANGYVILTRGTIQIEGDPDRDEWLLLDKSNGNPENGHGYVWVFPTRQAARDHKRRQNANPKNATLLGPWRVRACTSEFLKRERLRS